MKTIAIARGGEKLLKAHVAESFFARLRGLMLSPPPARGEALLLCPCNSVHMCFVLHALDIVYLDKGWQIIKVVPRLRPWLGLSCCLGAHACLELAAGEAARLELAAGQQLCAAPAQTD